MTSLSTRTSRSSSVASSTVRVTLSRGVAARTSAKLSTSAWIASAMHSPLAGAQASSARSAACGSIRWPADMAGLPLDHADGPQPGYRAGQPGLLAHADDGVNVLVDIRCLFGQPAHRGAAHIDPGSDQFRAQRLTPG